jgi:TrpR family transcriptional regulator, trp operon repressor
MSVFKKDKTFFHLIQLVLKLKDKDEAEEFYKVMFTPKEFEQLKMRIQILQLLKKGIPHHEIAAKLKIGVATVTRGSNMLKQFDFKILDRVK